MTQGEQEREKAIFIEHALAALTLLRHERSYADDDQGKFELGAVAKAIQENDVGECRTFTREEIADVFKTLVQHGEESLVQQRPSAEPELPKQWIDPVTGLPALNPHAKATRSLDDQMLISKRDPLLADYLEGVAEGTTYTFLAKGCDAEEAREKLRKLDYGRKEHAANPFMSGDIIARSNFRCEHDEATVKFYKREATVPVRIASLNRATPGHDHVRGSLYRKAGELYNLVNRAEKILTRWLEADAQTMERERQRYARETEALQKRLGDMRRPAPR